MPAKFCDAAEIKALTAVLTPPVDYFLRIGLYDNNNSGDPTLDISQFFLSALEGFAHKAVAFDPPATDGNSRANTTAPTITFTLGETPAAPVDIYGIVIFYDNLNGDRILVGWEYFGAPIPVSVNGQSIAIDLAWYCKDAEGVPA